MIKKINISISGLRYEHIVINNIEHAKDIMMENEGSFIVLPRRFVAIYKNGKFWGTEDIDRARSSEEFLSKINIEGLDNTDTTVHVGAYFQEIKGWWGMFFSRSMLSKYILYKQSRVITELHIIP